MAPGGRGRLLARGSHRSGRAQLRHPAPRSKQTRRDTRSRPQRSKQAARGSLSMRVVLVSPTPRSSAVVLRCSGSPRSAASVPPEGVLDRSAASLPRVLWGEFPALIGTIGRLRRLGCHRAALRCLRLALPCLRSRSLPSAGPTPTSLGIFLRGARTASRTRNNRALPGSWATLAYMPCSQTPAECPYQAITAPTLLPSAIPNTSAPHGHFRGSITRPARPLCTLRRWGRPHTTQHSVPVDGQSLPVRDLHPTGHNKRFQVATLPSSLPSPSSRLCLAQRNDDQGRLLHAHSNCVSPLLNHFYLASSLAILLPSHRIDNQRVIVS